MNDIDHDGDHVSYDDAVLSAVNISDARERTRLKRVQNSPGSRSEDAPAFRPGRNRVKRIRGRFSSAER